MLRGYLLKITARGVVSASKFLDFVGSGNERFEQFDDVGVCPGDLPVFDAVESRHAARVSIHHPKQNRHILAARFDQSFFETWPPGNFFPLFN